MSQQAPGVPAAVVEQLVQEGRAAERAARYPAARRCYEKALQRLEGTDDVRASALMRWIGRTHEAEGDHSAAFDCLEVAMAIAEGQGSQPDLAHTLNCRGILFFRGGDLERAEDLYSQARELAEECGEEELVAMVDQNLGNVANVHGDHELALDRYVSSLQRYRALGLEEYVGPLLTNIGRVQVDLRSWDDAEAVFRLAERSCNRTDHPTHHILIKVNKTRMYQLRGDWERARRNCEEAFELVLDLDEDRWLGDIHKHRGAILFHLGHPTQAEYAFGQALGEAERRGDPLLEAEVRNEMARLFQSQGRHREMLECLERAHRAFARLRARRDLADVDRQIGWLERSFEGIVRDWSESIESADRYTQGHCERVADRACELARAVGLDALTLTWFRMGALLHDVGKVAVPAEILNKRGPLSDAEWAIMREHPERGVELLAGVEFPWDIRPMVLHHHERWDGAGYPHGLKGENIPLAARILCVADVFDALTTTRSYRKAFSARAALEIMEADVGRVFDPDIFALFREIVASEPDVRRLEPWIGPGPTLATLAKPARRRPPLYAVG